MKQVIIPLIEEKWRPEQISGRLKRLEKSVLAMKPSIAFSWQTRRREVGYISTYGIKPSLTVSGIVKMTIEVPFLAVWTLMSAPV